MTAEVGRRTGELCGLPGGCLAFDEILDETGRIRPAPVLVHDMPKVGVRSYHLPISEQAAATIRAQQARVRGRYPHTPTAQLALFPAPMMNPRGTKACSVDLFGRFFRVWVDSLPELVGPGGEPYQRSAVVVYSWRHCYAQRHADQGTPIEVLAALMGHRQLSTTQGYYRVTQQRKRKAVDLLARFQVDGAAGRSRPAVERLLEAEHLRDAVGQVAVPFGICTNPTNVRAHGQACPFRRRRRPHPGRSGHHLRCRTRRRCRPEVHLRPPRPQSPDRAQGHPGHHPPRQRHDLGGPGHRRLPARGAR